VAVQQGARESEDMLRRFDNTGELSVEALGGLGTTTAILSTVSLRGVVWDFCHDLTWTFPIGKYSEAHILILALV
jgi:hypothetical protein